MKRTLTLLVVCGAVAAQSFATAQQYGQNSNQNTGQYGQGMKMSLDTMTLNPKQAAFRAAMRKLWEDHITWTRLFIVSAAGGLGDTQATTDRLMQNQVDIGNAIKPYYGDEAGNKLTTLLK